MSVWAGGRQENESHHADNPAGFTGSINISEKTPGKYNYFFEAKDKSGNTAVAGPENIYIDPQSDLPEAVIVNPGNNMRVRGNLNIAGICLDDDGVDHVMVLVTRGGNGEIMLSTRAEGAEFWSYVLDTSDREKWTDGVYTLTAWGVDRNGLSGISDTFAPKAHKKHTVTWNLDRKKPETKVTSHASGAFVSGKIHLKGTVFDGNGVEYFAYSVDGNRYIPASLQFDKKTGLYHWSIPIDTKQFDDGSAVIWFQARDGMGNTGAAAHLLFVNNTGPRLEIVYPEAETAVNGIFTAAGYASHPVGLRSLTWHLGRESGELPVVAGNAWWSREFDIRGLKASSLNLEIRAVDLTGNVTTVRRKLAVDQNGDLPRITLEEPADGAVLGGDGLVVKGMAADNDGVASVFYSVNAGPAAEIPCSGYFQFVIPDLPAGTHTLAMWAADITGITGPRVQVKGIVVPGAPPEPRLAVIKTGAGKNLVSGDFYTGIVIRPEATMVVECTVASAFPVSKASVRFGGGPEMAVVVKAGKDGLYRADVPVPAGLAEGLTVIELRASDKFGREGLREEYAYTGSYGSRTFRWVRAERTAGGHILLSRAGDTVLGLGGTPLQSAVLEGEGTDNFRVSVDEYGRVLLEAGNTEGEFGPLRLTLTSRDGVEFTGDALYLFADYAAPSLELKAPRGEWVQNSVPLRFSFSDANKIRSVDFSLDTGASWRPLLSDTEIAEAAGNNGTEFERELDIVSCNDGAISVLIRVTDGAGRSTVKSCSVRKDTRAPEPRLVVPVSGARVNGSTRLGFTVREAGCLKTIICRGPEFVRELYRRNGEYPPVFFDILTDPLEMPLDENMVFIFEDEAGNRCEFNAWHFIIDSEMDIPAVHISLPLENEVITADCIVSGIMYDDDAVKQMYWRIDDGDEQVMAAENGFSIPIAGLTDNEHSITVVAEDIYGVRSVPVTRHFRVSLAEPKAEMTLPGIDSIVRETIRLTGTAFDVNGIAKIRISLDNGNTYNDAEGAEEWHYGFNSKILKDGTHVVFIQAEDSYGISAIYSGLITIDNTPPVITLDSPPDGAVTAGHVVVSGRAEDRNLDRVVVEVRSLGRSEVPEYLQTRELDTGPIIVEELDLSGLEDGLYNIEIWSLDSAKNITRLSRNVELAQGRRHNFVEILYPLEGERLQGVFNLYGEAGGIDAAVTLRLNDRDIATAEVTGSGYYRFSLSGQQLATGLNRLVVHSNGEAAGNVESPVRTILYRPYGAWVTIDSLNMGDFAFDRPWLSGRAGYALNDDDGEILADSKAGKERITLVRSKTPDYIDISFDNGSTFTRAGASGGKDTDWQFTWRCRLETGEMAEGLHYIIVRATMQNGETALTRTFIQVDKTPPVIKLVSPQAGGRYNKSLEFTALASDDSALEDVSYHLRKGDKAAYEIPGFINGLYFETGIPPVIKQINNNAPVLFSGGATYMDLGMGLSFFDDNVKLQMQYGFMNQGIYESMGGADKLRYGGSVFGIKLLANVYSLSAGSLFGPDWDWLQASCALGANFSLFDFGGQGYTQSGSPTWLSAMVGQIEFPRVTLPGRSYLKTFSFFTEGQLWFVSTDVDAAANNILTVIPHVIAGLRMYIF